MIVRTIGISITDFCHLFHNKIIFDKCSNENKSSKIYTNTGLIIYSPDIIMIQIENNYLILFGIDLIDTIIKNDCKIQEKQIANIKNILRVNIISNIKNKYIDDIKERYRSKNMVEKQDKIIEIIECEENDDYSDNSLFNINSWGADLSFRELISMYEDDELVKPELQRKYVWDKTEASRFIESILMGLPVPSIFLAQSGSQKLIVDGFQRIMSVHDYVNTGIFSGDGKIFKLSNSQKINIKWRNKAFKELSTDDQRKIKSTTIHSIIFEQKQPKNDDSSLYQVFERINTSGRPLNAQEIRNCVYQGTFNSLLLELNKLPKWRLLFGTQVEDNRMRDMECILRFFAMKSDAVINCKAAQISLKKELNDFMNKNKDAQEQVIDQYRNEFIEMIDTIYTKIGENAFKNYSKGKFINRFHPTIFDAIATTFSQALSLKKSITPISVEQHIALLENESFQNAISFRTTDIENIKERANLASEYLLR